MYIYIYISIRQSCRCTGPWVQRTSALTYSVSLAYCQYQLTAALTYNVSHTVFPSLWSPHSVSHTGFPAKCVKGTQHARETMYVVLFSLHRVHIQCFHRIVCSLHTFCLAEQSARAVEAVPLKYVVLLTFVFPSHAVLPSHCLSAEQSAWAVGAAHLCVPLKQNCSPCCIFVT